MEEEWREEQEKKGEEKRREGEDEGEREEEDEGEREEVERVKALRHLKEENLYTLQYFISLAFIAYFV